MEDKATATLVKSRTVLRGQCTKTVNRMNDLLEARNLTEARALSITLKNVFDRLQDVTRKLYDIEIYRVESNTIIIGCTLLRVPKLKGSLVLLLVGFLR